MKDANEGKAPCARRFSEEFKRDAVRLVVDQGYSFRAAAEAVGVSEKSLRDWHARLAPKPEACGEVAAVAELKRAEMERAIKKQRRLHVSIILVRGSRCETRLDIETPRLT